MSTIHHNKIVRDKIPEIIRASGKTCHTVTLDDEAYACRLREKLHHRMYFNRGFAGLSQAERIV